jgi:hypothetical protein
VLPLHPKIQAALFAALATIVVSVAAAVADVYPDAPWLPILTALVPVVAGYLRSGPEMPLADKRVARLLDQDDEYNDLSLAEIKAIEARGRDLQSEVRSALYQTRSAYVQKRAAGDG